MPLPRALGFMALLLGGGLAGVLVAQHGFGLKPCALCLIQRFPYYYALALCGVMLLAQRRKADSRWLTGGLLLLMLCMVWSAGLGLYHSGVEGAWWQGPACSQGEVISQATELISAVQQTAVVPCDAPAFRLLGVLSLANMNIGLSLAVLAVAAKAYGSSSVSQYK